ncbi:MAG: hypothetical protein H6738_12180 [Alphaproteobacteria bacterium]|nr:hypothetical protein [Alphaproteobacteria bacterium]MCB9697529.1 hypothetical protein [Alphaproteobacteria bacterium]
MLLSIGIEFVGKELVARDGARHFDWYGGLVLKDHSATVTPDPGAGPALSRRWRQSPSRPDLCWEEIMGLPH